MHIEQLPRVESHYCRSSSSREYLDADLSISKLYDMYVKWCEERGAEVVRKHMYTSIFNQEYNISFVKPKKDRCDMCEKFRLKGKEKSLNEEDRQLYHAHRVAVENSRVEKKKDKETEDVIVSFDLEKALTLPKTDISNSFYKRKLSCYNLTGHLHKDKTAYCCLWTEAMCGRKGNDIASAIVKIL
ncbi:tRNA uridine 5-carboxymethylaminomethyl modification enzyme mnmg [Plakobranchus ocellatus]|uniref:tRNA uridine 5-carboxymethylaminomethyl modification enzyme mnmg n=1 Tax=Plakobranchus ocellatus TaxID=259542 RepID=A0AAV4C295_9GAST|nr:tRNA uridine 5-carboxymethylaminomethyl modification enzyme mnmg [Plakobranchus ocellatus]